MKDYFEKTVFVIRDGKMSKETLEDLCIQEADKVTSPKGVQPDIFNEGNKVYEWIAGSKNLIFDCENEEEAELKVLECFKFDLDENRCGTKPVYFESFKNAKKYLYETTYWDEDLD
jgi:hypothetical protein